MAVRLPRIPGAAGQVDKEHRWLPRLAPLLPLAIPVPRGKGTPAEGYPWPWSVYRWLDGEDATVGRIADARQAALDLGRFVATVQGADPTGGPCPGEHNAFRGVPLATRDSPTRAAIAALNGTIDADAATATWEAALRAPAWHGPPRWIHDDATWTRARGWALSVGLTALPYYRVSNPVLARISRRAIDQALADQPVRAMTHTPVSDPYPGRYRCDVRLIRAADRR